MRLVYHQTLVQTSFAGFSEDDAYRYVLCREWDAKRPKIGYCMLNPSIADAFKNDPTVERCERRAHMMGFGGYYILNAFALRTTDPEPLYFADDPIGAENDEIIREYARKCAKVVVGWGFHAALKQRDAAVLKLLESMNIEPQCLGTTKDGFPRHPLYVKYTEGPRPYRDRAHAEA